MEKSHEIHKHTVIGAKLQAQMTEANQSFTNKRELWEIISRHFASKSYIGNTK